VFLFEYSSDENLVHVAHGEGPAAETIEVEESVYLDINDDSRPIGVEFLNAADFLSFLERRGGKLFLPEYIDDLKALAPAS